MQVLTCLLRVYKSITTEKSVNELVRCFHFHIPPEAVANYYYVPPPTPIPEIPPARTLSPLTALLRGADESKPKPKPKPKPEPETVRAPPAAPTQPRHDRRDINETVKRLTKPTRPRAIGTTTTTTTTTTTRWVIALGSNPNPITNPTLCGTGDQGQGPGRWSRNKS